MDYTHVDITKQVLEESDTLIAQIIKENRDACYCGLAYADVSVFYYFTNFKVYKGTHNYNTATRVLELAETDRERAFAYCWKLHLAQDGVSHNTYVPTAIRRTKVPNYVIHPIKELGIEGHHLNTISPRMMEIHEEFDSLVEEATGRDWRPEAERLNTIIGGGAFYSRAFVVGESETLWGKIQNAFYAMLAKIFTEEEAIDYITLTKEATHEVLNGQTPAFDPSGEIALKNADKSVNWIIYGAAGILIYLGWKRRKK